MERLVSASLAEVLGKVGPSITAGGVNVLSVEAIRDRSHDRWPRKREQGVTFVGRAFARLCQPGDLIAPLNDTEFITIQPSSSRTAALAFSAKVLKETLEFFLGAVARQDLRLFQVTSFVNGELGVQPVATGRLMGADHVDPQPTQVRRTAAAPAEELRRLVRPHQVTLHLEPLGPLAMTIAAEPIWNARAGAVVSYALQPTVHFPTPPEGQPFAPVSELSPGHAADIALAVVDRAAELLQTLSVRSALHIPLPLSALAFSAARYRVLHGLRELPAGLRKFLILEVVELSQGLPPGRLAEVVSTLAPYGRAVLGRADTETTQVSAWRGCGLHGVSVDCSRLAPDDRKALPKLTRFVGGARAVAAPCVAYGLASRSLLMTAWAAGCTHLSGPAVSPELLPAPGPVRLQPVDLFAGDVRDAPQEAAGPPHLQRSHDT